MAKDKKISKSNRDTKQAKAGLNKGTAQELDSLSRQELVEIAKNLKVKNYSRMSKAELIKSVNSLSPASPKTKKTETSPVKELPVKAKAEAKTVSVNKAPEDLDALSRQELVDIAKDFKIKNYSRLNKTRLIKLISEEKEALQPAKTPVINQQPEVAEKKLVKTKIKPVNEKEELGQAELFEQISQHLSSPYVDKRDAKTLEAEEQRRKLLLRPSKFPKGKTNKEYLLEEEENLTLPELYEENKIVLLPVDPTRIYSYWNLNTETLELIEELNLQQLVLKINDVTGIIYNGKNAVHYWFESCLARANNWYIYLQDSDRNLKVELGYVLNGTFNVIATSNTIYVPRRNPSQFVADKFVIVTYPEVKPARQKLAFRLPSGKTGSFYRYDDQSISESFNTRRLAGKMPVFTINDDIPNHFVKEYGISGPSLNNETSFKKLSPPAKLAAPPPPVAATPAVNEQKVTEPQRISSPEPQKAGGYTEYEFARETRELVPQTIREQFEYFSKINDGKVIVDQYYYEIPGQDQKVIKVSYEWYEEGVPYTKEFYWTTDVVPQIHEKIYKVSWGPTWVKEFIGGSEYIRFIGASERFLGGSEQFIGGSEMFLGSSGRFMGASEIYLGGSDRFMGGSEIYLGGSEHFMGSSERHIGGSEQFIGASERYIGGSEQFIGSSELNIV
jgi:hypothetical protein